MSRALIVGAGISGAATALVLTQQGFEVDIAEMRPDHTVLGNGITLIAPAVRALDRLGVLEECLSEGFGTDTYRICDPAGNEIVAIPLPPALGPGSPGIMGMMRPVLHRILLERAKAAGAKVRLNLRPAGFKQDGEGVDVTFSDGVVDRYSLVVAADGLRSSMRSMMGFTNTPTFRRQGCFRAVAPRPTSVDVEFNFAGHPDANVGITPLGPDKIYIWINSPMPDNKRLEPAEIPGRIRELLEPFGGPVPEIRENIVDPALCNYAPFETIMVTDPWSIGRVTLLGDAAHSTTPQLAAGGAMCLEDAVVLGEELVGASSIETGLESFYKRRVDRCRFVVESSVQLSEWQLEPDTPGANPTELTAKAFGVLAGPY